MGFTSQESAWFAATLYGEESLDKLKLMDQDYMSYTWSFQIYTITDQVKILKYF